MQFQPTINLIGRAGELLGVLILALGSLVALYRYAAAFVRHQDRLRAYQALRQELGRAILVGLEILVAADIIRSVAIDPSFQSVGVLALIVLVRTFLSWSLEVEINGAWPWRRNRPTPDIANPQQR
ncbi:MAG TPA: DUF1622 domain-containing protein [Ktedonobacterales bacterium]|nr:DUF1622 domain-containing protein [Ktedonobacterales bacterium]